MDFLFSSKFRNILIIGFGAIAIDFVVLGGALTVNKNKFGLYIAENCKGWQCTNFISKYYTKDLPLLVRQKLNKKIAREEKISKQKSYKSDKQYPVTEYNAGRFRMISKSKNILLLQEKSTGHAYIQEGGEVPSGVYYPEVDQRSGEPVALFESASDYKKAFKRSY